MISNLLKLLDRVPNCHSFDHKELNKHILKDVEVNNKDYFKDINLSQFDLDNDDKGFKMYASYILDSKSDMLVSNIHMSNNADYNSMNVLIGTLHAFKKQENSPLWVGDKRFKVAIKWVFSNYTTCLCLYKYYKYKDHFYGKVYVFKSTYGKHIIALHMLSSIYGTSNYQLLKTHYNRIYLSDKNSKHSNSRGSSVRDKNKNKFHKFKEYAGIDISLKSLYNGLSEENYNFLTDDEIDNALKSVLELKEKSSNNTGLSFVDDEYLNDSVVDHVVNRFSHVQNEGVENDLEVLCNNDIGGLDSNNTQLDEGVVNNISKEVYNDSYKNKVTSSARLFEGEANSTARISERELQGLLFGNHPSYLVMNKLIENFDSNQVFNNVIVLTPYNIKFFYLGNADFSSISKVFFIAPEELYYWDKFFVKDSIYVYKSPYTIRNSQYLEAFKRVLHFTFYAGLIYSTIKYNCYRAPFGDSFFFYKVLLEEIVDSKHNSIDEVNKYLTVDRVGYKKVVKSRFSAQRLFNILGEKYFDTDKEDDYAKCLDNLNNNFRRFIGFLKDIKDYSFSVYSKFIEKNKHLFKNIVLTYVALNNVFINDNNCYTIDYLVDNHNQTNTSLTFASSLVIEVTGDEEDMEAYNYHCKLMQYSNLDLNNFKEYKKTHEHFHLDKCVFISINDALSYSEHLYLVSLNDFIPLEVTISKCDKFGKIKDIHFFIKHDQNELEDINNSVKEVINFNYKYKHGVPLIAKYTQDFYFQYSNMVVSVNKSSEYLKQLLITTDNIITDDRKSINMLLNMLFGRVDGYNVFTIHEIVEYYNSNVKLDIKGFEKSFQSLMGNNKVMVHDCCCSYHKDMLKFFKDYNDTKFLYKCTFRNVH
ncbi:hypothetical protein ABK040_013681 [Willaertia magna]